MFEVMKSKFYIVTFEWLKKSFETKQHYPEEECLWGKQKKTLIEKKSTEKEEKKSNEIIQKENGQNREINPCPGVGC